MRIRMVFIPMLGGSMLWAQQTGPMPPVAACRAGETQFDQRQFVAAQASLWECLDSGSQNSTTALHLALTYRAIGGSEKGSDRAAVDLKRSPRNEDLVYLAAYLLFLRAQYQSSLNLLAQAYRLKQDDWRVHQLFAMNFVELGMNSEAEQEFERSLALNAGASEVYYQLGRLYYTQDRYRQSIAASEKALAIAPEYAEAYDSLGLAYQVAQDGPKAVASYTRAIEINQKYGMKNEWPLVDYASLLLIDSPRHASDVLTEALALNPNSPQANYQMGQALRALGQNDRAAQCFERTIAAEPDFAAAYYSLAILVRKEDPARFSKLMAKFQLLTERQKNKKAPETVTELQSHR